MSYINESLSNDENVLELYKLHWFSKIGLWIYTTVSTLLFLVLLVALEINSPITKLIFGIFSLFSFITLYEWLRLRSIEYGVTNKRAISKTGIISRKTEEMKIGSIETVEINQGVLGRMFGFGTIKITGRGISNLVYNKIDDPIAVKKSVESIDEIQKVSVV